MTTFLAASRARVPRTFSSICLPACSVSVTGVGKPATVLVPHFRSQDQAARCHERGQVHSAPDKPIDPYHVASLTLVTAQTLSPADSPLGRA